MTVLVPVAVPFLMFEGTAWLKAPAGVSKPSFAIGARNNVLGAPRYFHSVIVRGRYTPTSKRAVLRFARKVSSGVVPLELELDVAHSDDALDGLPVVLVCAQEVTGIDVSRVSKNELIPGGHLSPCSCTSFPLLPFVIRGK